ncbi:MAG: hypothetical protein RL199_2192 [Pseudomonadota bacterium]
MKVAYLSDIEGQWERLAGFAARTDGVRLEGDRLFLDDDVTFVFGGDTVDRGPWGRRVVRMLLEAKARYGPRVVLIAGNRDLNKLRLVRELGGHPPGRAPPELHGDRPALLKFILSRTMGAEDAFEHRRTELAAEGASSTDDAVVESFLADLAPSGDHTRLVASMQLAAVVGDTLFVHGAVTDESLGHVPGREFLPDVARWVDGLNDFLREEVDRFVHRRSAPGAEAPWEAVVAYQAPRPGTPHNPASVVYGRLADAANNPHLPALEVRHRMQAAGIRRLVVGHTPCGDTPTLLTDGAFALVVADNSRGRVTTGSGLLLTDDRLYVRADAVTDAGEAVRIEEALGVGTPWDPVGRRVEGGWRVKGRSVEGRALLHRGLPGFVHEQRLVGAGALEELATMAEAT